MLNLCLWDLNISVVDLFNHVMGSTSIDGASYRLTGSEDFLDCTSEVAGHGTFLHHTGNVDDLIQADVAVVFH